MQISNTAWVLVGQGADAKLSIQNVGKTRIALVMGTALPGPTDIDLDDDTQGEHWVLLPNAPLTTIEGLNTASKNLYARSLGPSVGALFVYDPQA